MANSSSGRFVPPATNLLYKDIITSIFHAILHGYLKPGDRLIEEKIAQELGVSRSPVRQALQEMERQGIVQLLPRKGACVAKWNMTDLEDFSDVRVLLECKAAEQASQRITPQNAIKLENLVNDMLHAATTSDLDREIDLDLTFHKQLVAFSNNITVISIYNSIDLRIRMFMIYEKYISPSLPDRFDLINKHMDIVDSLRVRDAKTARKRTEESIRIASDALLERMRRRDLIDDVPSNFGGIFIPTDNILDE